MSPDAASAPRTAIDRLFAAIDALMAALLLAMVVMVFGNVVLRYGFNSGIGVSEELSRYCFVWLVFIGAVSVMRRNGHLGMDMLVERLGPNGRRAVLVLSHALILVACAMLGWGAWRQHEINATTTAPITGLSMAWVFGVAWVTAAGIGIQSLVVLARALSGRIGHAELLAMAPHGEQA